MGKKQLLSGDDEGLKVFGKTSPRRRARPVSYWLKSGLLAFVGVLNLAAALWLFGSGMYLLTTEKGASEAGKFELQVGGLQVSVHSGKDATGQQHGRETLGYFCLGLSLLPFSLAILARMQYQVCKQMALLPPAGAEGQQQDG